MGKMFAMAAARLGYRVHVFAPETRVFYGLERLWGSAERLEAGDL